jgi:fluoroquinolone transport system permease protein
MNNYITFIGNDLKIVFRDKTLILMFFLPVILILVCRILVPIISNYLPEINEYNWLIAAGFCILSGSTPAFLTAFLLLDEKDENLIPVLKVTPLPYSKLITYRVSFLMLTSFIFAVIFLYLNGLESYSFSRIVTASVLVAFIPAILLLFIIPFAKNKIEGVTLFKGINVVLFIPIIAFFIAPQWKLVFGIIPFYWIYEILEKDTQNNIFIQLALGFLVNGLFFYLLTRFFSKTFTKRIDS